MLPEEKLNEVEAELSGISSFLDEKARELNFSIRGKSIKERMYYMFQEAHSGSLKAIADKKELTEDALVYFRSIIMIAESIGMAGTHAEKSARLRGLIELLNTAISKLRNNQQQDILHHWDTFSWSYSEYPYRRMIDEYNQLKRENERMNKLLTENNVKDVNDELGF